MESMESMQKYYKYYSSYLKQIVKSMEYKLKYDYSNPKVLQDFYELCNIHIPTIYKTTMKNEKKDFLLCMSNLLASVTDERIADYFTTIYSAINFRYDKELSLEESKATVIKCVDNNKSFTISLPECEEPNNILYSVIMHELSHFSMIYGTCSDYYEYSETLSMFFEYMMLEECNKGKGYEDFINNRLSLLRSTFSDISGDLYFAMNPNYLCIGCKNYSYPLASNISYPESFEYTLNLIDRRKEDKELVDSKLGALLYREVSLDSVAKKLDFDTKEHKKILSLIKK